MRTSPAVPPRSKIASETGPPASATSRALVSERSGEDEPFAAAQPDEAHGAHQCQGRAGEDHHRGVPKREDPRPRRQQHCLPSHRTRMERGSNEDDKANAQWPLQPAYPRKRTLGVSGRLKEGKTLDIPGAIADEHAAVEEPGGSTETKRERQRRPHVIGEPGDGQDERDDQQGRDGVEGCPGQGARRADHAGRKQVGAVVVAGTRIDPVGRHRRKHSAGHGVGQGVVPGRGIAGPVQSGSHSRGRIRRWPARPWSAAQSWTREAVSLARRAGRRPPPALTVAINPKPGGGGTGHATYAARLVTSSTTATPTIGA